MNFNEFSMSERRSATSKTGKRMGLARLYIFGAVDLLMTCGDSRIICPPFLLTVENNAHKFCL